MNIFFAGKVTHEIKTTKIAKGWNVRCFTNGQLNQEIQVKFPQDIGVASNEMLRNEDKCGNHSDMATAARIRFNTGPNWRKYQHPHKVIDVRGSTVKLQGAL
jgi:hypothetical protein